MHTLNPSEAEIQQLNYERFHYPCAVVQKRMHTVFLVCTTDYEYQEIGKLFDRHPNTVTKDIKRFQTKGIEGLKEVNYGTNQSELDLHETTLKKFFEQNPVASVNEAIHHIKKLTEIERSPTQTLAFMKRIGLKFIKTGHIPAKADREKQENWINDTLEPALEQARQGKAHVLFMDAAHFVLAPFLCCLWCFQRIFIKAPAGRKRLNVLGAVNAINKQVHFMTNETYINADVIVDFLNQLKHFYNDGKIIYIVLDNARYQHCKWVKYIAVVLGIKLLFLPSYSPNLNIIERLWKFVKKKCLYAKFYDTFDKFKEAIINTMKKSNSDAEYIKELNSLLSLNFQLF